MNRYSLVFCLFSFSVFLSLKNAEAQYFEAGVTLGVSNYLGDLAPSSWWTSVGESNLAAGALLRWNPINWVSLKAGLNYGKIGASDSRTSGSRRPRNLSFRSTIYEAALTAELNLLGYNPLIAQRRLAPYLFGGIAVFQFQPQAQYQGTWYDLQALGTEGQGMNGNPPKYALRQIAIPLGLGVKYALNSKYNLGIEFGLRKTYTDYLDDVSGTYPDLDQLALANGQLAAELSWRGDEYDPEAEIPRPGARRGDPKDLDWYIFSGVFFSRNLYSGGNKKNWKATKLRCPKF